MVALVHAMVRDRAKAKPESLTIFHCFWLSYHLIFIFLVLKFEIYAV